MGVFLVSGLALLATSVYIGIQKMLEYISCSGTREVALLEVNREKIGRIECLYGIRPFEIDYDDVIICSSDSVLLFKAENDSENTL